MASYYVKSGSSGGAQTGTSWANAYITLAQCIAGNGGSPALAAGDTVYVSHQHAETTAAAVTLTFPGTVSSPNRIVCVNDGAEPPTAVATTATVTTTGTSALTITGYLYCYGVTFIWGTGSSAALLTLGTLSINYQVYESCGFVTPSTAGGSSVTVPARTRCVWKNCSVKFGNASQGIFADGHFVWDGGSTIAGTASNNGLFLDISGNRSMYAEVSGVDFTNSGTALCLIRGGAAAGATGRVLFRDCKLASSWTGTTFHSAVTNESCYVDVHCSDSADTNYQVWRTNTYGELTSETTLVRTGGASDGTTPLAWKIVSTANCDWHRTFTTSEIVRWNETTGSALTATVEILRDSATNLTDAEIWLEVMYLGTSGAPLGTWTSDRAADILATPADQADSSATWTTTGMTNPNTQKLSVSFTPQEKGYVHARVVVAKASTTVYVDPVITLA